LFSQLTLLSLSPFHDLICNDFRLTFIFLYPQDAALLRREFPQHDLFNDPIFAASEYAEFEVAVTAAVGAAKDEDPHLVAVQKALPAICDSLRTVTGVVKTGLESNESSMWCMNSSMQHMERRMATLENMVFTPGSRRVHAPMPAPTAIESSEEQPPTHRLSRGTTTITDLWKEWTVDLEGSCRWRTSWTGAGVHAGGMVPSSSSTLGARWLSQISSGLWQGEGKLGRWWIRLRPSE
jgi:hypothetical protein